MSKKNDELTPIRVFVSYSSKDNIIAGEIKRELEQNGYDVFLAHDDIRPSQEWHYEILGNLQKCEVFLPLFTENFKKSDWTDQESGYALALNKIIIPVSYNTLPYGFIGSIQAVKIRSTIEKSCNEIINAISEAFIGKQIIQRQTNMLLDFLVTRGLIDLTNIPQSFEDIKLIENTSIQRTEESLTASSILIVDSDKSLANTFKLVLQSVGFNVDTAYSGFHALYKVNRNRYDLVILDINLPDMLGDEVAEKIRESNDDVNIILITGYSSFIDELNEEELDIKEVLMKPIPPEDLVKITKKALLRKPK